MYGAIELGGTKICCGVGPNAEDLLANTTIETRDPEATLAEVFEFLDNAQYEFGSIQALGVASFGPVDLNHSSATYGSILTTPKLGWSHCNLLDAMSAHLSVPISITTDVNAALLAEHRYGAARGVDNAIYVTVGTGVGAGVMVNGHLVNGFLHPEVGHMRVPTYGVEGVCPFHKDCLEGLASGPAIHARAGQPAHEIPVDDPIWDEIALNLADLCNNLVMTLATERIVFGGGVMSKPGLLDKIKHKLSTKINGYLPLEDCSVGLDTLVVRAQLTNSPGLVGALMLAQQASLPQ